MNWTNQIADCRFLLDYVQITIVSKKPQSLVNQLSKHLTFGRPIPENKTKRPKMEGKFRSRSYFTFGKIKKGYLIHGKMSALQGIDALLYVHDVPLLELAQIGVLLDNTPAVEDYHFSCIEFKWDFYPGKKITAVNLQKHLVRHLHLANAQSAWKRGKGERVTYYINKGSSDFQSKVYIRPKKPNPNKADFVRFELRARTRWLDRMNLVKPVDFKKFGYRRVTNQVKWLDIDWAEVRRSIPNLVSAGLWRSEFDDYRDDRGIAKAIIKYRDKGMCPPRCKNRGHRKNCSLFSAIKRGKSSNSVLKAIEKCQYSTVHQKFEELYTSDSKFVNSLNLILRNAYNHWRIYPAFPSLPQSSKKNSNRKSIILSRSNKRKKRGIRSDKLNNKFQILF
jgi:hypothetical protein